MCVCCGVQLQCPSNGLWCHSINSVTTTTTQDALVQELQAFLIEVEASGKDLVVYMDPETPSQDRTAAMEARMLRAVLLPLTDV